MKISREHVTTNGRAAFYACVWNDLRNAALNCGWALGLHGSLASDMDIMAMPWTEDAKPVEVMIKALSDCFTDNPFADKHLTPHYDKPNGRVVYTMTIFADFYLDINVMQSNVAKPDKKQTACKHPENKKWQLNNEIFCDECNCWLV
jgi:hypothetical protein